MAQYTSCWSPTGEGEGCKEGKILEEIMTEKFPHLIKLNPQIQES